MFTLSPIEQQHLRQNVAFALQEDIGSGDITAELIPAATTAKARIICREHAVLCGRPWFDEVFHQIDSSIHINWLVEEGAQMQPDQVIVELTGNARALLTGERAALNFLQTLSGTATQSCYYREQVGDSNIAVLDTRKTIPGLRSAQKYAVRVGGCVNHRIGLYDAFLIKENHIAACGSITNAIELARHLHPTKPVEIEVESIDELKQAIDAKADIIMLDNFDEQQLHEAIQLRNGAFSTEVSGNITAEHLEKLATLAIDRVSSGSITKHLHATDFSMRLTLI